ncbi:DUF4340 domain-containing protein [Candidatus Sumerlaeota bacterium]|nr:DUF4340 domain-containing protein [Candidatus Sumerlaeota bacterium]
MSWRRTLVSGLCFLILASLVWLDSVREETREMEAMAERSLLDCTVDQIMSVTLTNSHGHFTLMRRDDGWWLTDPIETLADQGFTFAILHNVANGMRQSRVAGISAAERADYGLDDPQITAAFTLQDGVTQTLLVGSEAPGLQQFFATIEGEDEIFTVSGHIRANLTKTLFQLRDKRLFPDLQPDMTITAIAVTTEAATTRVESDDEGVWWIETEPERRPADGQVVVEALRAVLGLRATGFLDPQPLGPLGLDPPLLQVAVLDEAGGVALDIGLPTSLRGDDYYACVLGRGQIVTIAGSELARIPRTWPDWLDRDLLHFTPDEIVQFSITMPEDWADLNRAFGRGEDGVWHLIGGPEELVDQEQVDELLTMMARMRADGVVTVDPTIPLEEFGLQTPSYTFVWRRDLDPSVPEERLDHGGQLGDTDAHLRRNGEPVIYRGPNTYGEVIRLRHHLVDRHLVRADLSGAARIEYRHDTLRGETQLIDGVWRAIDSEGEPGQALGTEAISNALTLLAAAEHSRLMQGSGAQAVRAELADPPWMIRVQDAAGDTLADVRANNIPSASREGPLFVLADGERACVVSDREMLVAVQSALRTLPLH